MVHKEYILQKSVCEWIDIQHPKLLYMSDTIAAVKLTIPQAARNKSIQKKDFKCPDLMVFKPSGKYCGLFIELKVDSPYQKKSGELFKNDHLEAQQNTINDLRAAGYYADFSWGFDRTIKLIDWYLNLNNDKEQ